LIHPAQGIAMTITTISSREFNQDVSQAKRAASSGPVVITDRGKPAFVLLRHEAYRQLIGKGSSIRELLDHPASHDIAFDPPKLGTGLFRVPDLS
jgi:prevent-host-death family protein